MEYNLLTEPWIRVLKNGEEERVSLRELFQNAHEYADIVGPSDLQTSEYHIYRFLITVFCDAYRDLLGTEEDVFDVMFDEYFDMERMDRYFAMCEAEGHPFDMLNTDRPFLQASREVFEKAKGLAKTTKASKVYNIVSTMPAEDSVIFAGDRTYATFLNENNKKESREFRLPLEEYAYWLIEKSCQSAGDGGKLSTAIGGGIVTTVLIKGRNVFETIVLNAPPIPTSATVPMWRCDDFYPQEIDILSGMFTPNRIIYPAFETVDEKSRTISRAYLLKANPVLGIGTKSGEFVPYAVVRDHWKAEYDPHVVLQKIPEKDMKNGACLLKPATFYMNRKGFMRICDALGVTAADIKNVEDIGTLIFSRNIRWYEKRVRDSFGALEFAKICLYTACFKNSLIIETMKVGDNEFDLAKFITIPRIQIEAFLYAKACRSVAKGMVREELGYRDQESVNFDDESFYLFREFLTGVFKGKDIDFAVEELYQKTKNSALRNASALLSTIHLNGSYEDRSGVELYGYINKQLKSLIYTNLERGKELTRDEEQEGR